MKVLIFIDWFTPAYKAGGPIQSIYNLVQQPLDSVVYRIVCSNKDLDGSVLSVATNRWVRHNANTEVWYAADSRQVVPAMRREMRTWQPDVLFINGLYSLYFNLLPLLMLKVPRKIISARGMLHGGALTQKAGKKRLYLALWKWLRLHRKNAFHASTSEEKTFVEAVFGKNTKVFVAANFPREMALGKRPLKTPGSLELVSVALISPMKNFLAVLQALTLCKERIVYTLYGPVKDAAYWQQCLEVVETLPPNVRFCYKGDLPPPLVPAALEKAHVFILPSKSENFGHALYEALLAGKPVITSFGTPWNSLQLAQAGINVSPENLLELAAAVDGFAKMEAAQFAQWSFGAHRYARQAMQVTAIKEQYKVMFFDSPAAKRPALQNSKNLQTVS